MNGRPSTLGRRALADQLWPRVAVFAAWLAVVALLTIHHAPWRDEVRAFSLATGGGTLIDMLRGIHGEGHPALWYVLLRAAHVLIRDSAALPVVSVLVASAAMAVLVLRSPFSLPLIAALAAGKFALFEYAVSARNYGISMLLLFALAALYPRHRHRGPVLGLLLFLLANTNAHSVLLVAAFLLLWLVDVIGDVIGDVIREHGLRWTPALTHALRPFALNACIAALGVALCAATIYPPFNDAAINHADALSPRRLFEAVVRPAVPFTDLVLRGPWQALGLGPFHEARHAVWWERLASLAMFGSLLGLLHRPAALLAAFASLLLLSLFFTFVYPGSYRHQALWLVFLVTTYWVAMRGAGPVQAAPGRFSPLLRAASAFGRGLFVLLVALQIPGGVQAVADAVLDRPPYSRSRNFAALVSAHPDLAGATVMADPDFLVEPVPYYLGNDTYLMRERRFGNVVRFTKHAQLYLTLDDLLATARRVAADTRRPVLILLAERLDPSAPAQVRKEGYNWELSTTPEQVFAFQAATHLLARFGPAQTDESFDVYRLDPKADSEGREP